MKKILLFMALFVCFTSSSHAEDVEVNDVLAAAKFTGGCGVITQMFHFQDATKMQGGEEFITRFLNTEYARLGMSELEYFEACKSSLKVYTEVVNLNDQDGQR